MTDEKEQPQDDESETAADEVNEATITATVTADAEVVHPVEDDEKEG